LGADCGVLLGISHDAKKDLIHVFAVAIEVALPKPFLLPAGLEKCLGGCKVAGVTPGRKSMQIKCVKAECSQ
jgi:hypothetical protein